MSQSTGGNDAILSKALKDLLMHWDQTAAGWRDAARADFMKDYLDILMTSVKQAAGAVQRVEELLAKARKDCSE